MSTQSNVAELRPAAVPVPARVKDPTAPIRQRRHRAKKHKTAPPAVTVQAPPAPPVQAGKPSPIKANVTPRRIAKALQHQTATAAGIGAVAVTLTALSLSHLAHGIGIVTHADTWEAWAMAVGVDCSFIALEVSQLAIGEKVRKAVSRFARPAIWGTLAGSAVMNAAAFAAQADSLWMTAAAVGLGVAIPGLIYALTRVGAALYLDCHARA
jgi:hypothetical protein